MERFNLMEQKKVKVDDAGNELMIIPDQLTQMLLTLLFVDVVFAVVEDGVWRLENWWWVQGSRGLG